MGIFSVEKKLLGCFLGHWGDFNDIREYSEKKKGGRRRQEGSFQSFRKFIADMNMREVKFRGILLLGQIIEQMKALYRNTWTYFLAQCNGCSGMIQQKLYILLSKPQITHSWS